jgi:hypothetical protein
MGSISVRGLSEQQLAALKEEASRRGMSMNRLALHRLTDQAEVPNPAGTAAIEALAATWTQEEADAFTAAIAPLEQVDPELWA